MIDFKDFGLAPESTVENVWMDVPSRRGGKAFTRQWQQGPALIDVGHGLFELQTGLFIGPVLTAVEEKPHVSDLPTLFQVFTAQNENLRLRAENDQLVAENARLRRENQHLRRTVADLEGKAGSAPAVANLLVVNADTLNVPHVRSVASDASKAREDQRDQPASSRELPDIAESVTASRIYERPISLDPEQSAQFRELAKADPPDWLARILNERQR